MNIITLPAGTIGEQDFVSDTHYLAHQNGTTVENSSTADHTHSGWFNDQHDIILEGITFSKNGLKGDNAKNIKIKNCTIKDCQRSQGDHQAINVADIDGLELDNVTFINNKYCVILNGVTKNVYIHDCSITKCGIQIKGLFNPGTDNILVERVKTDLLGGCYYQVEFQPHPDHRLDPGYTNIRVIDCAIRRPFIGTSTSDTGGWSLPLEHASGPIEVRRCYFDSTLENGQRHPKGAGMMVEISASNGLVENCWFLHGHDAGAVNDSSLAVACRNNRIIDCQEPMNMTNGGAPGNNTFTNNSENVQLPAIGGWTLFGISSGGTMPTSQVIILSPAPTKTYVAGEKGEVKLDQAVADLAVDIRGDGLPAIVSGKNLDRLAFTVPTNATKEQKVVFQIGQMEATHDIVDTPPPAIIRTVIKVTLTYNDGTTEVR